MERFARAAIICFATRVLLSASQIGEPEPELAQMIPTTSVQMVDVDEQYSTTTFNQAPGFVATGLLADAAVGASTIQVALPVLKQLSPGMSLTFTGVGKFETKTIDSIDPVSGVVTLTSSLASSYPKATQVMSTPKATWSEYLGHKSSTDIIWRHHVLNLAECEFKCNVEAACVAISYNQDTKDCRTHSATAGMITISSPWSFYSKAPVPGPINSPVSVAFQARVAAGGAQVARGRIVEFENVTTALGGASVSKSVFRVMHAEQQGYYLFNFEIYTENEDSSDEFHFFKNDVDTGVGCHNLGSKSFSRACSASYLIYLLAGETVDVRYMTAAHSNLRILSNFNGARIHFGPGDSGGIWAYAFQQVGFSVITNVGNAYNAATSEFTANRKAPYYFSFSVPASERHLPQDEYYAFYVNGVDTKVACVRRRFDLDACSSTFVVSLNKGDKVTVKQVSSQKNLFQRNFYGGTLPRLTSFQGMLLRTPSKIGGTAFEVASKRPGPDSATLIWDHAVLARKDSTWYSEGQWRSPIQGTFFFSFHAETDKRATRLEFAKNGLPLGIGCYDEGSFDGVCHATAVLSVQKGDVVSIMSVGQPVAVEINPSWRSDSKYFKAMVSQYTAFQLDFAYPSGVVPGNCFFSHKQYAPNLYEPTLQQTPELCQQKCQAVPACEHFSWNILSKSCHLQGRYVQEHRSHYVVSGPWKCDEGIRSKYGIPVARELVDAPLSVVAPEYTSGALFIPATTVAPTPAPLTLAPAPAPAPIKLPSPLKAAPAPSTLAPVTPAPATVPPATTVTVPSATTLNWIDKGGVVPGALIAGGVTLAGAAAGGMIAALVHNAQQSSTPAPMQKYAASGQVLPVTLSWHGVLLIGAVCGLLAAGAFGLYLRRRKVRESRRVAEAITPVEEELLLA